MQKKILAILRSFIFFGRNLAGSFNSPYQTFRKLSGTKTNLGQTVFIFFAAIIYFVFVSTLRTSLKTPFLLTMKFNVLVFFSAIGFLGLVTLFYCLGKIVGGKGTPRQIFILWSFSLAPTILWFATTSILYLLLPPPRTMSFLGKLYSLVFISFSLAVLVWKMILYYLTLRFSLKLDLWRIILVSVVVFPAISAYSLLMYGWGVFRIPFL